MKPQNMYSFEYYDTAWRLIHGETQRTIAKKAKLNKSSICKRTKTLINFGIIKEEKKGLFKVYVPTPATDPYMARCYEAFGLTPDTGGMKFEAGLPSPEGGQIDLNLSTPGVEHLLGMLPGINHVQFTVGLHRKLSTYPKMKHKLVPGQTALLEFPYTVVKTWNLKQTSYHYLMNVYRPDWRDPITVHYTQCTRKLEDSLQISFPVSYVLSPWLENYPSLDKFFLATAEAVAKPFTDLDYELGEIVRNGDIEFPHKLPLFKNMEDLKAMRIDNDTWIDFSTGEAELETKNPLKSLQIRDATRSYLNLPMMEKTIKSHTTAITNHEKTLNSLLNNLPDNQIALITPGGWVIEDQDETMEEC